MSSGGMDWAYRVISAQSLDPLGVAIVMHLGWRDVACLRTDRGIAKALNQHRTSVARATAKLAALGVIARRSGQWVACETIAIVEQSAAAVRPSAAAVDVVSDGVDASRVRTPHASTSGRLTRPPLDASRVHKRKENIDKGARALRGRYASPLPFDGQGMPAPVLDGNGLSAFQRSRVLSGQSVLVDGATLHPATPAFALLVELLRNSSAGGKGGLQ